MQSSSDGGHPRRGCGPNPMMGVLIRRGKFGPQNTGIHRGKAVYRQKKRLELCSHKPGTPGRLKKDSSLAPLEGSWPCQHLGFRILT